jgi:hypothetical protein
MVLCRTMSRRGYQSGADLSRAPEPEQQKPAPAAPQRPQPAPRPDVVRAAPPKVSAGTQAIPGPRRLKKKTRRLKRPGKRAGIVSLVVIVLLAGGGFAYHQLNQQKVVPKALVKQMPFPIYYPDPKKLPAGYTIDKSSFNSPAKDVVLYAVDYKGGKLVFSVQLKPSAVELNAFNTQRIPLHDTLKTSVGTAVIGAIGKQSIISLPTDTNAWVIVTAPYNTDQPKLSTILKNMHSVK